MNLFNETGKNSIAACSYTDKEPSEVVMNHFHYSFYEYVVKKTAGRFLWIKMILKLKSMVMEIQVFH